MFKYFKYYFKIAISELNLIISYVNQSFPCFYFYFYPYSNPFHHLPLFNGTKLDIAPLQTGHMLCFDFFTLSPQSMQTHIWPQGMMMQLACSERQIVHSSYCSSLCPLISCPPSPSSFSAFDNPKILLISNGKPFIYIKHILS